MSKPRLKIEKWEVLTWPLPHLTGIMLEDHHTNPRLVTGRRVYTSLILNDNRANGEIETRNTVYELVGPEEVASDA